MGNKMAKKFNEPTLAEIKASFSQNSDLARSIHGFLTWVTYEKFQAHTWALRLIKADPSNGEECAAALTNYDHMIEGAKALYRTNRSETYRYDSIARLYLKWKAEREQAALAA
jgi:hypothetical protein